MAARAVAAYGGDQGGRFPTGVGDVVVDAGTAGAASVQTRHVCSRAGFIDEHKAAVRYLGRRPSPMGPRPPYVGTAQLGGTQRLFFNGRPIRQRA
jgi:hypothetical protein